MTVPFGVDLDRTSSSAVIVGARLSGKSTLAHNLSPRAVSVRRWLQTRADPRTAVAEQVDHWLDRGFDRWVVDDAELLLELAPEGSLARIASAERTGATVQLVRNLLVHPTGRAARMERRYFGHLMHRSIPPFAGEVGLELAQGHFPHRQDQTARAEWLLAWSGGSPGLMFQLSPYVPGIFPHPSQEPDALGPLCSEWAAQWGLTSPARLSMAAAVLEDAVPPMALLGERERAALGFYRAIGALGNEGITGHFWRAVLSHSRSAYPALPEADQDLALNLAQTMEEAGLAIHVARLLGLKPMDVAGAFERFIRWLATRGQSARLPSALADLLGEAGLLALLEAKAVEPPPDARPLDLALTLLRTCGAAG